MSKRETEKMIKEIWKEKMADMRAGRQTDLAEFVFQHIQKRVGIVSAVIEVNGFPLGIAADSECASKGPALEKNDFLTKWGRKAYGYKKPGAPIHPG